MTSKGTIRSWLKRAKRQKATHMLVVCDTFDYDDYPVFILPGVDLAERAAHYHGPNMQRVMECYDLALPLEPQLAESRAWHGWRPANGF